MAALQVQNRLARTSRAEITGRTPQGTAGRPRLRQATCSADPAVRADRARPMAAAGRPECSKNGRPLCEKIRFRSNIKSQTNLLRNLYMDFPVQID